MAFLLKVRSPVPVRTDSPVSTGSRGRFPLGDATVQTTGQLPGELATACRSGQRMIADSVDRFPDP